MLRPLAAAVLFLTRIPLPALTLDEHDMARSAGYFAWVGGLLALCLWGCSFVTPWVGPRLGALLVVTLWVLLTGGLHLDGLADSVDGLSGGRGERARTLSIMRDSRIGSHGALALVLLVLLKAAALERALSLRTIAWLIAPVAARFACTLLMALFPYARQQGLGAPFVDRVRWPSLAIGMLAVSLAGFCLGPLSVLLAALAIAAALLLGLRLHKLLGGLTGDVYGAAIELAELAALLAASVAR